MKRFRQVLILAGMVLLLALPGISTAQEDTFVGEQDVPPRPVKRVNPTYPLNMSRAGVEARVVVDFVVDSKGNVVNAHVFSSNNPWFERPAINAISKWHFEPGLKEGRPVNARMRIPITFSLTEGGRNVSGWKITKGKGHESLPPAFQWETAPKPVDSTFPIYPFDALVAGTKGKTLVQFIVGKDGSVIDSKVIETSAPEFGEAVQAMIETWKFDPALKADGSHCFAVLSIGHEFSLTDTSDVPVSQPAREILRLLKKHSKEIKELNELDSMPTPERRTPPVYPTALRNKGMAGEAMIEFFIDKVGDAQLPHSVSATSPEFGYAATQAVATWRFSPPTVKGKPVIARARIPVSFATRDASADQP